jgi:hypothetical protein
MQYGLIGAGPVNEYFAGKLPRLRQQLGPVAATNHRLASRIVNTLRCGAAVRDLSELAECHVILICAPGNHIEQIRERLLGLPFDCKRKVILLCECDSFSMDFNFLSDQGALVASLRSIPGAGGRYLVEGHRLAIRTARKLLADMRASAVEIPSQHAALYCAALTISSSLFTPILQSCLLALRGAGMTGVASGVITEALFSHNLRMFMYSGRKSWTGALARGEVEEMQRQIEALEGVSPEAAQLYRSTAEAALQLLAKPRRPASEEIEIA